VIPGLLTAPLLAACGGTTGDAASPKATGAAVAISASDSACAVDTTTLPAGEHTFAVTNKGAKITEVYLYGEQDGEYTKVLSEVENIGPGTSRNLTATLSAGQYEIACKPGQAGSGIRTRLTVTGG
jgi:iron uptake system EfeUOB component EfeO/EfeM